MRASINGCSPHKSSSWATPHEALSGPGALVVHQSLRTALGALAGHGSQVLNLEPSRPKVISMGMSTVNLGFSWDFTMKHGDFLIFFYDSRIFMGFYHAKRINMVILPWKMDEHGDFLGFCHGVRRGTTLLG